MLINIRLLIFCFLYLGSTKYLIIRKENTNPIINKKPKNRLPDNGNWTIWKIELEAYKKIPTIAIKIVKRAINKKFPERPSLYKTKIKQLKTSIVPGSGWKAIKIEGIIIRRKAFNLVLKSLNLEPTSLSNLAIPKL